MLILFGIILGVIAIAAFVAKLALKSESPDLVTSPFNWTTGICGVLALFMLFGPFVIIGPGQRGVVMNFGAVQPGVLSEGLHVRVPFYQTVVKVDCRIQKESVKASAASKDMQTVNSEIAVNYRVNGNMAGSLYKNVGLEYPTTIIAPAIQEAVKSVTAQYTAEQLINQRQDVSDAIKFKLDKKMEPYGIIVANFSIVDFGFSEQFNTAIEAKQTAEQMALKSQRDLQRVKIEAEQKVAQAKAEAESLKVQKQEITPELLKLRQIEVDKIKAQHWNGVGPTHITMLGGDSNSAGTPMVLLNNSN